jgi:hypothetical protein
MQLKTILNRVQKIKSFVYGAVRWVEGAPSPTLEVELHPRANGRPVCSGCGQSGPGYDRLPARRFEFVPLWGMRCSWSMRRDGWSVRAAGYGWRRCPGRRANTR